MGRTDKQLPSFLSLALDGGEWSTSRTGHFTSGKETQYSPEHTGWVGPTASLGISGKRNLLALEKPQIITIKKCFLGCRFLNSEGYYR
jgi:hypothetical protein